MAYRITEDCVGCGKCRRVCPWKAVIGQQKQRHVIEPTLCQECSTCWFTCPKRAVVDPFGFRRSPEVRPRMPKANIDRGACVGCQNCLLNCEQGAIQYKKGLIVGHCNVDQSQCIGCGKCMEYCANISIVVA
jgi:MinD superfamily P-loop ATPase